MSPSSILQEMWNFCKQCMYRMIYSKMGFEFSLLFVYDRWTIAKMTCLIFCYLLWIQNLFILNFVTIDQLQKCLEGKINKYKHVEQITIFISIIEECCIGLIELARLSYSTTSQSVKQDVEDILSTSPSTLLFTQYME